MDGVDRVHLPRRRPGLEHLRLFERDREHVGAVLAGDEAPAMHRLVGEHARLRRVLPGEVELGADIAGDRLGRLALGVELVERAVPFADQVADDRPVDRLLRAEVVVDVGLGQAGSLGDLGDARAVIALLGEDADRRLEDRRLVAGGDAGIGADAAIGGRSLRHLASLSGEPGARGLLPTRRSLSTEKWTAASGWSATKVDAIVRFRLCSARVPEGSGMALALDQAMREILAGWREDLDPAWRAAIGDAEPGYDRIDPALVLEAVGAGLSGAARADLSRRAEGSPHLPRLRRHPARRTCGSSSSGRTPIPAPPSPPAAPSRPAMSRTGGNSRRCSRRASGPGCSSSPRRAPATPAMSASTADWERLIADIEAGRIDLEPAAEIADRWVRQGVLLLNSSFTLSRFAVEGDAHQVRGHLPLWRPVRGRRAPPRGRPVARPWFSWASAARRPTPSPRPASPRTAPPAQRRLHSPRAPGARPRRCWRWRIRSSPAIARSSQWAPSRCPGSCRWPAQVLTITSLSAPAPPAACSPTGSPPTRRARCCSSRPAARTAIRSSACRC